MREGDGLRSPSADARSPRPPGERSFRNRGMFIPQWCSQSLAFTQGRSHGSVVPAWLRAMERNTFERGSNTHGQGGELLVLIRAQ